MQFAGLRNEANKLRSQVELIRAENQRFKLNVETLEYKLRAAIDEKMQAEEETAAIIENLNGTVCVCVHAWVGWCVCVCLHAYVHTHAHTYVQAHIYMLACCMAPVVVMYAKTWCSAREVNVSFVQFFGLANICMYVNV